MLVNAKIVESMNLLSDYYQGLGHKEGPLLLKKVLIIKPHSNYLGIQKTPNH